MKTVHRGRQSASFRRQSRSASRWVMRILTNVVILCSSVSWALFCCPSRLWSLSTLWDVRTVFADWPESLLHKNCRSLMQVKIQYVSIQRSWTMIGNNLNDHQIYSCPKAVCSCLLPIHHRKIWHLLVLSAVHWPKGTVIEMISNLTWMGKLVLTCILNRT